MGGMKDEEGKEKGKVEKEIVERKRGEGGGGKGEEEEEIVEGRKCFPCQKNS